MKHILFLICIFLTGVVFAEGQVIDPTRVATKTFDCDLPTEYTDNSPLDPINIMGVQFFRGPTAMGPWQQVGETMGPTCLWTEMVNLLVPGQYYYHVTVMDNIGLFSGPSNILPVEVRISVPPKPASGLRLVD